LHFKGEQTFAPTTLIMLFFVNNIYQIQPSQKNPEVSIELIVHTKNYGKVYRLCTDNVRLPIQIFDRHIGISYMTIMHD